MREQPKRIQRQRQPLVEELRDAAENLQSEEFSDYDAAYLASIGELCARAAKALERTGAGAVSHPRGAEK